MSNYSAGRDPHPRLRLAALTAVIAGVVLLAAAAFVLSYAGIHALALHAGVTPQLARLYPLIFDAMLVVAGAAALALRGAGWWARAYAWFALLLLLAAVATGDAVHATHVALPIQPIRTAAAITPWVLLLLAFGLWLEMLRYFRRARAAGVQQGKNVGQAGAASEPGPAGQTADQAAEGANGDGGSARTAVTWANAGGAGAGRPLPPPRTGLDTLLGPREGEPPAMPPARPEADAATEEYPAGGEHQDEGRYPDPVSYGEETGYVHPESFQDHGGYPGHDYPADHEADEAAAAPAAAAPAGAAPGGAGHGDSPAHSGPQNDPARPGEHAAAASAPDEAPDDASVDAAAGKPAAPGGPTPAATRPGTSPAGSAEAPQPNAGTPPAAKTPPEAAQTIPAGEAPAPAHAASPPGDDPFPETPASASASTPWLERLRSAPAPPEE